MTFEDTPFEDFSIEELAIEELESCLEMADASGDELIVYEVK